MKIFSKATTATIAAIALTLTACTPAQDAPGTQSVGTAANVGTETTGPTPTEPSATTGSEPESLEEGNGGAMVAMDPVQTANEIMAAQPLIAEVYNSDPSFASPRIPRNGFKPAGIDFAGGDPDAQARFVAELKKRLPQYPLFYTKGLTEQQIAALFEVQAVNYNLAFGLDSPPFTFEDPNLPKLYASQIESPEFDVLHGGNETTVVIAAKPGMREVMEIVNMGGYTEALDKGHSMVFVPPFFGMQLDKVNGRWVWGKNYATEMVTGANYTFDLTLATR